MPLSLRIPPEKKKIKIPINDVWIAASCMEVGGKLLTGDKHFNAVEQIETIILGTASKEPKFGLTIFAE